jgi:signal transduction histidine kinase
LLMRRDELAELGQDFDRMAERIESLVTNQRDLMADVSHALRSPLARLNVALGLARREPAATEHLDRIEQETDRLNKLIGQLLMMARVDSGVDLGRRTQFDLGALVYEVAADAEYEARSRQCTVVFAQRREYMVEASRELLRGAVENVVRNAVRHTEDGTSVDISVECRTGESGARAIIQVRDHGAGVPGTALESLFTPFFRLEDASQRFHGSGLGLAITRRTFEVHGGATCAENAPGGGLVVSLELPLSLVVGDRATPRTLPTAVIARSA